jgi:hypothetical protein
MSDINLADTHTRWRWRRIGDAVSIDKIMVPAADMPPSGYFTDTLLKFVEAQSLELPPEAASFFPQGIPDPALGRWYKGTVETGDTYADPLDNDAALGTFWAKLWAPTPTDIGKLTILLFQYNFRIPNLPPTIDPKNALGVRIFAGNLWEDEKHGTTFYGTGIDNWSGHTPNTFALTQEPWPQS